MVPGGAVTEGDRGEHQLGAQRLRGEPEPGLVAHGVDVGEDDVQAQRRGVHGEHLEVGLGAEPVGLAGLRREVERDQAAGAGLLQRLAQVGDEQVGEHAGEPGAGSEHHPVGLAHRCDGLRAGDRLLGAQRDGADLAGGGGDGVLPDDLLQRRRVGRVEADHLGHDVERDRARREHPAHDAEQAADEVEGPHLVAGALRQAGEQQVAHGVPGERAVAREAVLEQRLPGAAPVVVAGQRGERHPQVAGRERVELAAQPAARAAVVGHGDDRGEPVGGPAQRLQAGRQPVTAAEGDHAGGVHSRPRSRWTTCTSTPGPAIRAASASVMATLRCLPPVQPTASRA